MVIKGKARGGPVALAAHLERRDTNERVTVLELRGVTSRDVLGALREMDCMGSGAASTRTLYHAAINTAPNERLTDEQKQRAADRLEKEMGFEGQPRIIVEHFKKDREHMHVVFLRIDIDRMVAIPDSHNYRKHEIVARELEREFGHERVQGAHIGREDQERPQRTPGHHEMQQAERSGLSPKAAKEQITRLWNQADSGRAFAASVQTEGWVLAKGDKRDFVLVDSAGETHSLARRIEGAKAADVRQRMADVDLTALPTIAEAKALQRHATSSHIKEKKNAKEPGQGPVILKVAAPAGRDAAKSFQVLEPMPGRTPVAATVNVIRLSNETAKPAKPEPPKSKLKASPPGKLKGIYSAAAAVTLRAYDKAKGLFAKQPARVIKPPQPLAMPPQPAKRPVPVYASTKRDRHHIPTPGPRASASAATKKLTREQLNQMIGRQRERRAEHDGPSR
jgi:hypothetical protein